MSARANTPLSGAREARPSVLRRLVAKAAARELAAFVVPGPDVARARGIDLEAAGLGVADTPRHASVLLLTGELPPALKKAAAVAFAQMPRPRAILAVGAGDVSPLPEPDVAVEAGALGDGVEELRRIFAEGAFAREAEGFDVDEIRTRTEYSCPMHPEVTSDEPGSCPKCGMDLVPREAAGDGGQDHEGHDHSGHGSSEHEDHGSHEEHGEHGDMDHEGMDHEDIGHEDMGCAGGSSGHEHAEHGEHGGHGGHGHMDHGDMGFMSMVEMTQGTPRSSDGLQMEWTDAPFGPLFPGLPGGLSLTFTLDGDTVADAEATTSAGERGPEGLDGVSARGFLDRLALVDPLSPVAYRVLAHRALENAAGTGADERSVFARVGSLERERAASHLGWLLGFGHLLGYPWLETRAGRLQLALLRAADADGTSRLAPEVGKLLRRIQRTPLLARRLRGIGVLPEDAEPLGPVLRARGVARDAREGEEAYRSLRFEPVTREGDDALARLRARLAEIEESLGLVRRTGSVLLPEVAPAPDASGTGEGTVETPRGTARLRVTLEDGAVSGFVLDVPSARHIGLVGAVAEGREVADALVGAASLDLSPWGVAR